MLKSFDCFVGWGQGFSVLAQVLQNVFFQSLSTEEKRGRCFIAHFLLCGPDELENFLKVSGHPGGTYDYRWPVALPALSTSCKKSNVPLLVMRDAEPAWYWTA